MQCFWLPLFVLCLCSVFSVDAYKRGDVVRTDKRSWYGSDVSPWTPLISSSSPRFNYNQRIDLHLPNDVNRDPAFGGAYKIAFSFDDAFLTPWITVWEGPERLDSLVVSFTISGDDIVNMRYTPKYTNTEIDKQVQKDGEESGLETADTLQIVYEWHAVAEANPTAGTAFVFIVSVGMAAVCLLYTIVGEQVKVIRSELRKRAEEQASEISVKDSTIPWRNIDEPLGENERKQLLQPESIALNPQVIGNNDGHKGVESIADPVVLSSPSLDVKKED